MADLVVFGEDWGGLPSSTQHLMRHLIEDNRVIWVNSIGMRSPKLTFYDIKRLFTKALSIIKHKEPEISETTSESPYIIQPKVLPFHGSGWIRELNKKILKAQLFTAMELLNFENVILWISLPTACEMVGSLNEMSSIYYCCDDFASLEGVDHKVVVNLEQKLISKVDVVLVSSKSLLEKHKTDKTVLLSHGVDYRMFATDKPRPEDLPNIRPIAGFYGSISEWVDIEMLAQSAMALPSWDFVFIGKIKTDVSILQSLPNVTFIAHKDHHQLPAYVQHWDVAMLPFKHNDQIEACNPLKLREYLASGTTIASTSFPAVLEYKNVVAIQNKKEHFFQVIQRAYKLKDQKQQRQQLIAGESWSQKALDLVCLFDYLQKSSKQYLAYKNIN